MGTRHLIAIFSDNEYKLAQYGQWDGYPDGQGLDILRFLRTVKFGYFRENLSRLYQPTEDEIAALWAGIGVDIVATDGMVPIDASEEFAKLYPTLHRNCGAKILEIIMDGKEDRIPTRMGLGFAGDSLFCEWAYVIDLDKGSFEVFRGFNSAPTPADSRFPSGADWLEKTDGYEPVVLAKSYLIVALPTNEQFLEDLTSKEDAE